MSDEIGIQTVSPNEQVGKIVDAYKAIWEALGQEGISHARLFQVLVAMMVHVAMANGWSKQDINDYISGIWDEKVAKEAGQELEKTLQFETIREGTGD